ncbi:MAG: YwqG family protein [Myxococcota bacterium]|nr:YwqG family protein [Myxococcota bacterium]
MTITLQKEKPARGINYAEWSVWTVGNVLKWFDYKGRAGMYQHAGDSKNSERKYASEAEATAAMERAIKKKLADGWEYEEEPPPRPEPKASAAWKKKPAKPHAKLDLAKLRKSIKTAKLEHRSADIESLVRPAIRLKLKATKTSGMTTRFGGDAMVPAGFKWPKGLAFVGQIRLDEVAKFDLEGLLPKRGVIALFAQMRPVAGYGEKAKTFYFPDAAKLSPMSGPDDDDGRPEKIAIATPSLVLTLPTPDTDAAGSLGLNDDEHSRYHDQVWLAHIVNGHQLLGWPSQMNHYAYKGWELLAQVDSDDVMGLEIGDVETMRFHIAPKQLAAKQFGKVQSEIGGD